MKKLPLGIQTFRKIIEDDALYIDKTKDILRLIENGSVYFLSRPRRFGKSLLVSTLKEIFSGSKDLFKDLYIHDKIEWKEYPVIHIDFSTMDYETTEMLKESLVSKLHGISERYNLGLKEQNYKVLFEKLIIALNNKFGSKVVVLVDEYDKPIIDYLTNLEKAKANREVLRNFYSILKGADASLRFVFLTGVSKFSKISVFSGLNNILDITLDDRFSTITGITTEELHTYFSEYMTFLAEKSAIPRDKLLDLIQYWYNGYSWDGENRLYNPTSLLTLFTRNKFGNYWFTTATPTFLIEMMNKYNYDITDIEENMVGETVLDSYEIDHIDVNALLLQTGYLTVKKVTTLGVESLYTLSCPNNEVKDSLANYLIANYVEEAPSKIKPRYLLMVEALKSNDLDTFITYIRSMFAKIPYTLHPAKGDSAERENYYHSLFYLMLALMGVKINLEVLTDKGRMDGVLELENSIYVIELKRGTPQEAIDQIDDKKYYESYLDSGKEIFLLGIGGFENKDIGYICKQIK